jgi:hypothetical protein
VTTTATTVQARIEEILLGWAPTTLPSAAWQGIFGPNSEPSKPTPTGDRAEPAMFASWLIETPNVPAGGGPVRSDLAVALYVEMGVGATHYTAAYQDLLATFVAANDGTDDGLVFLVGTGDDEDLGCEASLQVFGPRYGWWCAMATIPFYRGGA